MSAICITGPSDVKEMEAAIERELDDFAAWFTRERASGGGGNSPMIPPERALLRTYLIARLSGRVSPQAGS